MLLARGLDQFTKLLIELVDALVSFQVDDGELLDHSIFLAHRDRFELVNFFLHVPKLADGLGQLSETLAQRAAEFGNDIPIFLVDLVLGKGQPLERNVAGHGRAHEFIDLLLELFLLRSQAFQSSRIVGVPQLELDRRQLVAQ